ncbi:MAG: DUF6519 domain-containing protein [Acidimicrobiia bacterium]
MAGDHTRFTFDALDGFSGVHKQQGRVSLDADFNEFEEILDRRSRAEMYDIVGEAVVPLTTLHGFEILVDANNALTIGVGRAYVDGILAECFGDMSNPANTDRDDKLGGVHGQAPVKYDKQPFFYQPNFPTLAAAAGSINLAYLDVWQREVTVFEDPSLRDPALNGPDTATRIQTAWQVKVMQGADASTCDKPPAAWTDLIAPSTARLTSQKAAIAPTPGPCVIDPPGGYTGLENRLYRVEIHDEGTLGGATKATFKWSRDNASLAASVLSIRGLSATSSVITVTSTGRDTWMRFGNGDQIELMDDDVEFAMRETGTGGKIARIVGDPNHATGEITIDADFSFFAVVAARHPRIRRWDTPVGSPSDLAVREVSNGVPIPLEEGITITFGNAATDTLHAGDYWVFSARTADGSIEELHNAPPRGVTHHYARLALITSGTPPTWLDDCRQFWPPKQTATESCDCTVCVSEESHQDGSMTIKKAVAAVVAAGGGKVCIENGFFEFKEQVTIEDSVSVQIEGKGLATVLEYTGNDAALSIARSLNVRVQDFTLVTQRDGETPRNAIEVSDSVDVMLDRVSVFEDAYALLEFISEDAPTVRSAGAAIALDGLVAKTTIADCLLAGGAGITALALDPSSDDNERRRYLVTADLAIERNLVLGTEFGIRLGAPRDTLPVLMQLDHTRVSGNSIYGCRDTAIDARGYVPMGEVVIRENVIGALGQGIVVGSDRSTVVENDVSGFDRSVDANGIALVRSDVDALLDCRVLTNRVDGFGGAGIYVDADVDDVMIKQNIVRSCGGGIVMSFDSSASQLSIENNEVSDIEVVSRDAERPSGPTFGICVVRADGAQIVGNSVCRIAVRGGRSIWRAGIQAIACPSLRIAGNDVVGIGAPEDQGGLSLGISAMLPFERIDVVDNSVKPVVDAETAFDDWHALFIGGPVKARIPSASHLFASSGAVWWISGGAIRAIADGLEGVDTGVRGNVFESAGRSPAVNVSTGGHGVFAENRCHRWTASPEVPIVELELSTLALSSNHVLGPVDVESTSVNAGVSKSGTNGEPAATVLGNITNGLIEINGLRGLAGTVWEPLNITVQP